MFNTTNKAKIAPLTSSKDAIDNEYIFIFNGNSS